MTPGTAGSLAFAGMPVGAPGAGNLSGRLGRRWTTVGCVTRFTVFMPACGFAPHAEIFGAPRFLVGIGLGGLVPSANTPTAEFVSGRHRSISATVMLSGVPLGGCPAAVVAIPATPTLGSERRYFSGGTGLPPAALPVLAPPESPAWLRTRARTAEAERIERQDGPHRDERTDVAGRPGPGIMVRAPYSLPTAQSSLATVTNSSPGTASARGCRGSPQATPGPASAATRQPIRRRSAWARSPARRSPCGVRSGSDRCAARSPAPAAPPSV
ncbi:MULTISPECIES: MFS transporter [Streptomyces]|uniref:MFS transporter n=1 Tax=Streptomyces TaxID=1883 RepID=UPI00384FD05E